MHCMSCGAEMRLMQVVRDNTMMVPGYEHHTMQCMGCNEVERRFVFSRESTEPVLVRLLAPAALASSMWQRALARLARTATAVFANRWVDRSEPNASRRAGTS